MQRYSVYRHLISPSSTLYMNPTLPSASRVVFASSSPLSFASPRGAGLTYKYDNTQGDQAAVTK